MNTTTFYEVTVTYQATQDNGAAKRLTESYILPAVSFSDAEATVIAHLSGCNELRVTRIRITPYVAVIVQPAGRPRLHSFFRVKYSIHTTDDEGRERSATEQALFEAETVDETREAFKNYLRTYASSAPCTLDDVSRTRIVGFLRAANVHTEEINPAALC